MARERRNKGVRKRVATTEIAAEPGMYEPKVTGDDLMEYRDVAAAFPPASRNHENSWEVHQMLMNHPGRLDLIKQPWTEASLAQHLDKPYSYVVGAKGDQLDPLGLHRNVADVIRRSPEGKDVEELLLEMEARGLVEVLPDGRMLVRGTRAQLMEYGMDPSDKAIFDQPVHPTSIASVVPTPMRHREASQNQIDDYMEGYSGKDFDSGSVVLVHGKLPGDNPMLFPRSVLDKARKAGERLVEFTEPEMQAWRKEKGDKASVRFVLDFADDKATSVTKDDLDEAWHRNNATMQGLAAKIGTLDQKVASAATSLLAATEDAETPGWTLAEITQHLKVDERRATKILQDMMDAGHLDQFVRSNGQHAYRLNTDGQNHQLKVLGQPFDDDDPRLQSKQWFADVNEGRK